MSIIKLAPSVKCYNWGGEKLRERFGLQTDKKVAQSWVLSALEGRESELITSKYAGMLFSEYLKAAPAGVLGTKGEKYPVFPLAVKFSDNQENSIVQVNPDTDRSSLWYVVGAGEKSVIYFGMADEITQVELLAALSSGNLGQYLRAVPVKAGSVFRVDPGIVYAYGSEVQLLEMDVEAPEREMSREEVLGGISLQPVEQDFALGAWAADGEIHRAEIGENSVFKAELIDLNGRMDLDADTFSFKALVFLEGSAVLERDDEILHAEPGDAFFVEAETPVWHVTGNAQLALISLV